MEGRTPRRRRIKGYIFRPWKTRPDGIKDWAKDHGLKAWKIPIYEDE